MLKLILKSILCLTNIVTASFTTPATVTVTALVTETRIYSVNTCNKNKQSSSSEKERVFKYENAKQIKLGVSNLTFSSLCSLLAQAIKWSWVLPWKKPEFPQTTSENNFWQYSTNCQSNHSFWTLAKDPVIEKADQLQLP